MRSQTDLTSFTLARLLAELKHSGIRYALLRDYDQIRNVRLEQATTDIDMVLDSHDLPAWRLLLARIAEEENWDAVAECDHWARSPVRQQNVEVFRLYRSDPLKIIQIHLFHAWLLFGVPLADEGSLLIGRRLHPSGYFRLDRVQEHISSLFHIEQLLDSDPENPDVGRHRTRVLETWDSEHDRMCASVRRRFPFFGERAVRALQDGDFRRFRRLMSWAKLAFLANCSARHPFWSARAALAHAWGNGGRFITRQCGRVLKVHAPEPSIEGRFSLLMDELAHAGCIDGWRPKTAGATSGAERAVLELGGILVEWTGPGNADLVLDGHETRGALLRRVFDGLIAPDRLLFRRAP